MTELRNRNRGYLQHLYIALGSLGETVSGVVASHEAGQISGEEFEAIDGTAFKLENALLRLIERLEQKRDTGDWTDMLTVRELNVAYDECSLDDRIDGEKAGAPCPGHQSLRRSITPSLRLPARLNTPGSGLGLGGGLGICRRGRA